MLYLKLIALLLVALVQVGLGANRVTVLKCCRIGESLQGGVGNEYQCEPGAPVMWTPLVYAHKRGIYLAKGTHPVNWVVAEMRQPTCTPPSRSILVRSSSTQKNFLMFANGSLWLQESQKMLAPTTFCVDSDAAFVCSDFEQRNSSEDNGVSPLIQAKRKIKVMKCCGEGAAYSEKTGACVASIEGVPELQADDLQLVDDGSDIGYDNGTIGVQLVGGFPVCVRSEGGFVIAGALSEAALNRDGALQVSGAGVRLSRGQFCLERVLELNDSPSVFACSESVPAGIGVPNNNSDLRFTLYPVGLLISTAFLLATLVAGFLLPNTHHALHWKCQTHYIACLLVGDLILAITQLAGNAISGTACITMAILMHFFFLAAFFWLNTMCFNIWWTFRDFRPTSLEKRQEVCRLRVYEVFAWGGPLLIAGVAALLDYLPPDPLRPFLRPRFGVRNCWFYGDMEILTFFFGPIGILLGVNLLLFASTARQLTCGLWKREDVKSTTERAALGRVCMKLVVVMGVTWVADVISWAVGGPDYVWYITDLINALQGVLIFIVVGCQPQVWAAAKKIWCLKRLRSNVTNTTGAPMHSSSQGLPSMGDSVTNNTIANNTSNNTSVKIPLETVC